MAVLEHYEQRAPEYDDLYLDTGVDEQRNRPGWHDELAQLVTRFAPGKLAAELEGEVLHGGRFLVAVRAR